MPKELSQVEIQFLYYNLYPAMLLYGAPVIPNDRIFEYASSKKWTKLLLTFNEYYMRIVDGHLSSMGSKINVELLKAIAPASETFIFLLNKTTADEMPDLIRKTFGKTVRMRGGGDDRSNAFRDYMMQSGGARMKLVDLQEHLRPQRIEVTVAESNTFPKDIYYRSSVGGKPTKVFPGNPLYASGITEDGDVYFYHIQTNETSWDLPPTPAPAAAFARNNGAGVGSQPVPAQRAPPHVEEPEDNDLQLMALGPAPVAHDAAHEQQIVSVPQAAVQAAAANGNITALITAVLRKQHMALVSLQEGRFGRNIVSRMESGMNLHSQKIKEELDKLASDVTRDLTRIKRYAPTKYARLNYNLGELETNTNLSEQSRNFIQTIIEALNTFDVSNMLKGVRGARKTIQDKRKNTIRSVAAAATVAVGGVILYKWMTSEEAPVAPPPPSGFFRSAGELLGSVIAVPLSGIGDLLAGMSETTGVTAAATSVSSSWSSAFTNASALVKTGAAVVGAYTAYEVWSAVGVAEKDIDDIEKGLKEFVVGIRVQLINKLCDDYILSLNTVINGYKAGLVTQPFALAAIYSTKGSDAIRRDIDQQFYLAHELQERSFPLLVTQLGKTKAQEVNDMYVALIAKSKADISLVLTEMKHAFTIPEERAKWGLNRAQNAATAVVNAIGGTITSLAQTAAMGATVLGGGRRRVTRSHTRRKGSKKSQSRRR